MILIFGAILMDIHVTLDQDQTLPPRCHSASSYHIGVGGHAAIQALAAAKSGARAALIGQVGDDHYGKNILLRLRQRGVITSGVARHESLPTGTIFTMGRQNPQSIMAFGASAKANIEQIPREIVETQTILLLQDELPAKQNTPVFKRAEEQGARLIFTPTLRTSLAEYDLSLCDDVIIPQAHKSILPAGLDANIITIKENGDCIYEEKGQPPRPVNIKEPENFQHRDTDGAFDAFCGTYAAGLSNGFSLEETLSRAVIAAKLTSAKTGHHETLPYLDEINDWMKNIEQK
ncbi:MAG: hypothetical protein KDI46_00830 [Alphaproteobacteria bacterium]|nr:hypothetical protein [Alphaproteobacteria bacterium]